MLLLQLIKLLRPDSHRHRRPYVNIHDRKERTPKGYVRVMTQKTVFYEELEQIFDHFPKYHMKILIED